MLWGYSPGVKTAIPLQLRGHLAGPGWGAGSTQGLGGQGRNFGTKSTEIHSVSETSSTAVPGKTKGTRILGLQTCTAQASSLALTSGLILSGFHFPPESYSRQETLPIHMGSGERYGLAATPFNAACLPNFIDMTLAYQLSTCPWTRCLA